MSVYHHVKSKEELLDGMVDLVFGEINAPVAGEDWRPVLRDRAESTRTVLKRHPWAISTMDSRTTPGPATLGHQDAAIGCLRGAGLSNAMAGHALSLVDSYVHGFVQQEVSLSLDDELPFGLWVILADSRPRRSKPARLLRPVPPFTLPDPLGSR